MIKLKQTEILNNQFKVVFSQDNDVLPPPPSPEFPIMTDINITDQGVLKLLQILTPTKPQAQMPSAQDY